MRGNLFMLGWRALGSPRRRWQVQYCVDLAEAERIAAGLVGSDGGGRWRVYGFTRVELPDGPVRLERRDLLAEGVVRPSVRQTEGIHHQGATAAHHPGDCASGSGEVSGGSGWKPIRSAGAPPGAANTTRGVEAERSARAAEESADDG